MKAPSAASSTSTPKPQPPSPGLLHVGALESSKKNQSEVELLPTVPLNDPKQPQNNRFLTSLGNFPRINSAPLPVSWKRS